MSQRLDVAEAALGSLEDIAPRVAASAVERDAAILRFQYTFESVWKAAQHRLRETEGVEVASPKAVIRACLEAGLLDSASAGAALEMADDRNLAVHTYNEPLAKALAGRIGGHARLLRRWLAAIRVRQ